MGSIQTIQAGMGYGFAPENGKTCRSCAHSARQAHRQGEGAAAVRTWCMEGSFLVSPAAGCDRWQKKEE